MTKRRLRLDEICMKSRSVGELRLEYLALEGAAKKL